MDNRSNCPPTLAPVAHPLPSFWNAEPRRLDDHRSTPDLPQAADVVIIGGGYAGVTTAYHLLQHQSPPKSIILLEARKLCSGASGRNGGHVKPDRYYGIARVASSHGMEAAAEVAAFEADNVWAIKQLVEDEGLDCDFHLTRAVDVFLDPTHAAKTEAAYRGLVRAGAVDLRDVDFVPQKDAERISGVKDAQCCFTYTAAHLWPLKLVHQLLQRLFERHGAALNLQANTPATSVSAAPDNHGRWTVQTDRGSVRTRTVVYATNGYTAGILPQYAGCIVPVRGVCSRIVTPGGAEGAPHIVNTYGIRFDERNYDYLIPRADGSIVVGGAGQRFWHRREAWFDNVRDDELIEEGTRYFDGYMQRHYRSWQESGARTDRVWTGIMGYSSDFMPHVGHVPGKPGQFILAGFTGHGMPQVLLTSKGLTRMILDGTAFEDTGIPRTFKTTEERITSDKQPLVEFYSEMWGGSDARKE